MRVKQYRLGVYGSHIAMLLIILLECNNYFFQCVIDIIKHFPVKRYIVSIGIRGLLFPVKCMTPPSRKECNKRSKVLRRLLRRHYGNAISWFLDK